MLLRAFTVICLVTALTGCANEHRRTEGMQMLGAGAIASEHTDLKRAAKQTMSSRMLAAIALQRVTGRKPDPARFNDVR